MQREHVFVLLVIVAFKIGIVLGDNYRDRRSPRYIFPLNSLGDFRTVFVHLRRAVFSESLQ